MIESWMVRIPGGDIHQRDDRKKTHWRTHIETFLVSQYLMTQAVYAEVMSCKPSTFQGLHKPVETVSWLDTIRFCNALSDQSGLEQCYRISTDNDSIEWISDTNGYRLLTDAEWEYACRARSGAVQYGDIDDIAWYEANANRSTQDVGLKQPNDFGLYDMLGNVWEWCWDLYDPQVYGRYRVFRGGGWSDESRGCLASNRRRSHPTYSIDDLGFRVARSL